MSPIRRYSLHMNIDRAASCLEALGNPTRLAILRALVRMGRAGTPVGNVQRHLDIPPSTLSHHLARLVRVGLVRQVRQSRHLICQADFDTVDALVTYLTENCCAGLNGENDLTAREVEEVMAAQD